MAGVMKGLIFNGARRTSRYWFYWLPSSIGFYYLYKYLKTKYAPWH
jgi:UcrQ family